MADAFEEELEKLVTRLSRELAQEITSLILRRLGIEGAPGARALGPVVGRGGRILGGPRTSPGRRPRPARAPAPSKTSGRRTRSTAEERQAILREVESAVSSSSGLSLGEIEKKTGRSRAAVSTALKTLKDQGRMFMGGTRRFARYATSQAGADRASHEAHGARGSAG